MLDKEKEINISSTLKHLGVLPNEIVMIHGDAGVAAQFTNLPLNQRVQE